MQCLHCQSVHTSERPERTEVGSRRFPCRGCPRECHVRPGTAFNRLQSPSEVVCLIVVGWLRYKVSFREFAERFLPRAKNLGTYATVSKNCTLGTVRIKKNGRWWPNLCGSCMKFVRRLQRAAHPTFLDARFHGHDVIPAKAGIQEFAQILDMSHLCF